MEGYSVTQASLVRKESIQVRGKIFKHLKSVAHMGYLGVEDFAVGSIDDLRCSSKGGLDPSGFGQSKLAADILWSDPSCESGFKENDGRGIGMVFGPEVTEVCMPCSLAHVCRCNSFCAQCRVS